MGDGARVHEDRTESDWFVRLLGNGLKARLTFLNRGFKFTYTPFFIYALISCSPQLDGGLGYGCLQKSIS